MKLFSLVLVALAISAQADESEYHNYQTHYDQHKVDPYAGYNTDLTSAYSNSIAEKQDELDMDVILPIVVFGGLGLGALAYIDSLNRMNNLCNKLREITNLTPMATNAAVALASTGAANAGTAATVTPVNAAINSNTIFIKMRFSIHM